MHMLSRRLQILLDEERYERLARRAAADRTSIGMLVREAIDARYPAVDPERDAAFERIRNAEPMSVPVDPAELKREIAETRRTSA
jgi:hypothetical protein